jgi:phosphopantetheinyl transferase
MSNIVAPPTLCQRLSLERSSGSWHAVLCLAVFPNEDSFQAAQEVLCPTERQRLTSLDYTERRHSFLAGRWAAKQALAAWAGLDDPSQFAIQNGVFDQPVVNGPLANLQVSISHCDNLALALAFPEAHPMGVDLEKIHAGQAEALADQFTPAELGYLKSGSWPLSAGLTRLWTAKEALGKTIRTGLMTPLSIYETQEWSDSPRLSRCAYRHFAQYRSLSFFLGNYACSLCHPANTTVDPDLAPFRQLVATAVA